MSTTSVDCTVVCRSSLDSPLPPFYHLYIREPCTTLCVATVAGRGNITELKALVASFRGGRPIKPVLHVDQVFLNGRNRERALECVGELEGRFKGVMLCDCTK